MADLENPGKQIELAPVASEDGAIPDTKGEDAASCLSHEPIAFLRRLQPLLIYCSSSMLIGMEGTDIAESCIKRSNAKPDN